MYHRKMPFYSGDSSYVGGYQVVRADRGPCPVCGHPTGDCTGVNDAPKRIWGLGDVPSMVEGQTVLVPEDIWEEQEVTAGIYRKVLVARAGSKIPLVKARELGIFPA